MGFFTTAAKPTPTNAKITTFEEIPLELLTVDMSYQRTPGPARLRKITREFNPNKLGAIQVSKRDDGKYYVMDGWHRTTACREVNYSAPLSAIVYHGITPEQEAFFFRGLNDSKNVSAIDRFRARVRQGDDLAATKINSILSESGLRLGGSSGITAIGAVEKVFEGSGFRIQGGHYEQELRSTIGAITEAYGLDKKAFKSDIVGGVGYLINKFPVSVDTDRLSLVMSEKSPQQISGGAKALVAGNAKADEAVAYYLYNLYNKGLRANKLPMWVLI